MFQLHTFGGLALEDSGRTIIGAGAQRSRLVLLAVLAASGDRGISRDSLLALLWPESDTESARGALKQALYALRRDLAEAELTSGTTVVKMNRAVIGSDLGDFHAALDRGDLERAVGLYRGPFLEGVHLPSAGFDQWLTLQRSQLAELHRESLERLARTAEDRGDYSTSVRWWRAVAAADPLSAAVARSLMQALVDAGDSAAALRHARVHEELVRAELDSGPDPSVVELVGRIRRGLEAPRSKAPRVAALDASPPWSPPGTTSPASPSLTEATVTQGARRERPGTEKLLWIGVGAAALTIGIVTLGMRDRPSRLDPDRVVLITAGAVPPLRVLDSLPMAYLASRLAERDPVLTLSRSSLPSASASGNRASEVARDAGARYVVEVNALVKTDSVWLGAVLTDAVTGLSLAPVEPVLTVGGGRDDGLRTLGDRIAIALASKRGEIFSSWADAAAMPTTWESFEQLSLGIKALTGTDTIPASTHFQAAATLDSSSATPLVWDAFNRTHSGMSAHSDSVVAALERSARRFGPWDRALLAVVKARNRGDKAGAHAAGHRLLEVVPNTEWGVVVAWDVVGLGRYAEALELMKRVNLAPRWTKGWGPSVVALDIALHSLGDYQGELDAAREELRRDPDERFYLQMEVKALAGLGRIKEVQRICDRAMSLQGNWIEWQPYNQAWVELRAHGQPDAARSLAEGYLAARSRTVAQTPMERALEQADVHSELGDWPVVDGFLKTIALSETGRADYLGLRSLVQASQGDRRGLAETQRRLEKLANADQPIVGGQAAWWQAQHAALLGDRDEAVALLAKAFREGVPWRYILHWVAAFDDLRGYPSFEALARPVEDAVHVARVLRQQRELASGQPSSDRK